MPNAVGSLSPRLLAQAKMTILIVLRIKLATF